MDPSRTSSSLFGAGTTAAATLLLASVTAAAYAYSSSSTSAPKMTRSLDEDNVVIVGASSGVGLELALQYARQSTSETGRRANLHLVARRPLTDLEQRCRRQGASDVGSSAADASNPKDVLRLYEEVKARWSRVDTIIVW